MHEHCTLVCRPGVHSLFIISSKSTLFFPDFPRRVISQSRYGVCFNLLERAHFWGRMVGRGSSQSEGSVTHAGKMRTGIRARAMVCDPGLLFLWLEPPPSLDFWDTESPWVCPFILKVYSCWSEHKIASICKAQSDMNVFVDTCRSGLTCLFAHARWKSVPNSHQGWLHSTWLTANISVPMISSWCG